MLLSLLITTNKLTLEVTLLLVSQHSLKLDTELMKNGLVVSYW